MPAIIFLLPLIPLAFALRRSPGWLFVCIYLPALLLVPDTFHTTTGGIPKVSVNQAIIMTILPLVLIRYGSQWRLRITDVLVFALVVLMATSEYQAAGYKEAQNLTFGLIASAIAPYLVARLVIPAEDLHVAAAKAFVMLIFVVILISLFEFRFGYNPFLALIGKLFPGQGTGWSTTFRYGLARVAGPFSHAILAGVMIAIAYRLQRWLQWGGYWEPHFAAIPGLPWKKASVITAVLLLGAIMTVARGPWLGAAVGALVLVVGRSSNRQRMMLIIGTVLLVVVPVAYLGFESYLDIKPGMQMSMSQESALYRKVLINKYMDIALDHAMLGWGRNTWPKVGGMESIDNYFLLLSLMHGVLATLVLVSLFVWQGVRLFLRGLSEPPEAPSLAFTHVGILIAIFVSLVTVYLGEQVVPALFLILGWSEAILIGRPQTLRPSEGIGADQRLHFRVLQ